MSRIVRFPLVEIDGVVQYPDDISFFANTVEDGGDMVAEYTGSDISILDGSYPIEVETPFKTMSGNNFMETLGDDVNMELMDATDTRVKIIVKMFDAVIAQAKPIYIFHPEAQRSFDYLEASAQVPSFDAAKRAELETI